MTKRQRTLFFSILAILFLVTAPSILFYSQGYRIDFTERRITQTGAFYFKIIPNTTEISVDGDFTMKSDFLFGRALTKNFLPGSYTLEVAKEGFHTWQKKLDIAAKEVTESKNIILFPQTIEFQRLHEETKEFWPSPDSRYIIVETVVPELLVWNVENGSTAATIELRVDQVISDITWSPDSTRVLLQTQSGEQRSHTVYDVVNPSDCEEGCNLSFLGTLVDTILFHPFAEDRILATRLQRNSLALLEADFTEHRILQVVSNDVVTFRVRGEDLLWLDQQGKIWLKNLRSDSPSQDLTKEPFVLLGETEYTILTFGNSLFLKEGQRLYHLLSYDEGFDEIFNPVDHTLFSPDQRKFAFTSGAELWLYFLQDIHEQPQRKKEDRIFLTRFSQGTENILWLTAHYLVFSVGDTIKIVEIDDRDGLNIIDIAQFPNPKLFWYDSSKTLYILSDGILYASEKLF